MGWFSGQASDPDQVRARQRFENGEIEIAPAVSTYGSCGHRWARRNTQDHVICQTCTRDHGPFAGHA